MARFTTWTCVFSVILLVVCMPAAGGEDDWLRYGHDGRLTGRSCLTGRMAEPRLAWSYPLAGRELVIEAWPAPGGQDLTIHGGTAVDGGDRRIVVPGSVLRDLDGSGALRPAVESYHERWAKVLPDVAGLQRTAWSHTWTTEEVCRLQLFAYDRGHDQPRLVWESDPPEGTVFSPLNIVGDIDADGVQEICTAAHYRIMIFEGTTGRKETELRYHGNRPYGWFGATDVDDDDAIEFVTIGDFQSHVDVLDYDPARPEGERLSVQWRRDIETDINQRTKWPRVGPRPVADVTGDGRPEIVLSLFNDNGDGQWHVVLLDANDGKTVCDWPMRFCQGVADVDGDSVCELFLAGTDGVYVPDFDLVELVEVAGGKSRVLWSHDRAGWAMNDLPVMEPTWSTSASQGMQHVLIAGGDAGETRPAFAVRMLGADDGTTELAAMRFSSAGKMDELWRIAGLRDCEVVALEATEGAGVGAVLRVSLGATVEAKLSARAVSVRVVESKPLGMTVSSPIAARLRAGGPMTVVAEGPGRCVFAIEPPSGGEREPSLLWQRPGRGMADGSRALGPVAADLDGDGDNEVIVANRADRGHAVLAALDHDGSTLWTHAFEQTPGHRPVWNTGALTFWWPGCFRDGGKVDLFVNTRRGFMHSDVGHLLDSRSGKAIWSQSKATVPAQFSWGYAGIPLAMADVDNDGLDELACLHPVCFWIADGRTGEMRVGKDLATRKELPAWAAYGEPIVHDFTGDGKPDVLLDSVYVLGLLDQTGTPIWHGLGRADYPTRPGEGNVGETTGVKHAMVDFDGDGRFEIASAGYGNGVRAIDPHDGKILWSLDAPKPTCHKTTGANVDGTPGDELIYTANDTLIVVTGDRSSGRLLWRWQGPAALSMPAIADVDGDSLAEIVLQDAQGTIHCLDSAAITDTAR